MPAKRSKRHSPNHRRVAPVRASSATSPLAKFTSLEEEVARWLLDSAPGVDPDALLATHQDMTLTVRLAQEAAGLRQLGAWNSDHVTQLLDVATTVETRLREEAGPDGVDPLVADLTQRVVAALPPLVAFLVSTGRWSGTAGDLDGVRAVLDQVSPAAAQADALTEVLDRPDPDPDPDAETAALTGLPLARQLLGLLRWAAPHREVTADGQLLTADLPEAAAAVGVVVGADGPASIRDVPRLAVLWRTLDEVELLEWSDRQVRPAVEVDVLAGDQPLPPGELSIAVETALDEVIADALDSEVPPGDPGPLDDEARLARAVAVFPVLAMAATGDEVPAEVLAAADGTGGTSALLAELVGLGVLREGVAAGSVVLAPGLEKVLAARALDLLEAITAPEEDDGDDDADGV